MYQRIRSSLGIRRTWPQEVSRSWQSTRYTTDMPRVNHVTAFERSKKPIWFSSSSADPLAAWRISGIKGPVFEQWLFDSISDDGKALAGMIFARDSSYALLGHGHLRMEFQFVFEDGTHYAFADWMDEATITDTGGQDGKVGEVKGVWKGKNGTRTYTHTHAADGSFLKVVLDSPEIRGTYTLTALAPPHFPTGQIWPLSEGEAPTSTELCPKVNNVEVIPAGTYEADLVVGGRPLKFKGIGGHEHIWASGGWFSTVRRWAVVRAVAGPYCLTFREFTSLIDGKTYISGFLTRDGAKVFGALIDRAGVGSNVDSTRDDGLVLRWEPTYDNKPGVSGPHFDKSTGFIIHLKTSVPGENWKFEFTHHRVCFDVNFGGGETGLSGFLSTITGGQVGGDVHSGVAHVNICDLPRKFPLKFSFYFCRAL